MALTTNVVPRSKGVVGGHEQVQDSAITDDGSTIALGRNSSVTGNLVLAGTLTGVTTAITGTKNNKLTISVPNQTADAAGKGIAITADAGAVGDKNGGDITITPGAASGAGTAGSVVIAGNWTAASQTCADLGTVSACTSLTATTGLITTVDTNVAAAGVTLAGTTLAADGTDAAIDINVTPKGTGSVVMSKVDINGGTIDGATIGGSSAGAITGTTITANTAINSAGDITSTTAAKGLVLKRGADGLCGTFIANEVTPVSVATSAFAITDAVIISLNTVGGTVGALPHLVTATAGVGFDVVATAGDTSTYNWAIIKNAA